VSRELYKFLLLARDFFEYDSFAVNPLRGITMKKLLFVCAALVMALCTVKAHAADVTGTWTTTMASQGGDSMQLSFTFKQDGTVLTGSITSPMGGDPMAITDGKVDGNKITFKVSFNGMTMNHEGVLNDSGDEIKLSTKSDGGDMPAREPMTLKKAK
jgi:hypothetical protein